MTALALIAAAILPLDAGAVRDYCDLFRVHHYTYECDDCICCGCCEWEATDLYTMNWNGRKPGFYVTSWRPIYDPRDLPVYDHKQGVWSVRWFEDGGWRQMDSLSCETKDDTAPEARP